MLTVAVPRNESPLQRTATVSTSYTQHHAQKHQQREVEALRKMND